VARGVPSRKRMRAWRPAPPRAHALHLNGAGSRYGLPRDVLPH
jgi:hypothetical protein